MRWLSLGEKYFSPHRKVCIERCVCRKGLSGQTYQLSKSLRLLGSAEDNTKLAAALQQLADVEEKVEKVHEQQAKDDFFLLSELIHDYIGIVGAVRDAFNERVKAWQSWQTVQRELTRRREHKAKAELASKTERVMQLRQEIAENERQLDMAQVRTGLQGSVKYLAIFRRKTLRKYPGL